MPIQDRLHVVAEGRKSSRPQHPILVSYRTLPGLGGRALFYQDVRKLGQNGEADHGAVFIDGATLESGAGCCAFCNAPLHFCTLLMKQKQLH